MKAKYEMANAIVARYHGLDTAEQEESWFRATFSERNAPEDAPVVWMPQGSITVYELVRALLGDDSSNSDVRRLIKGGGVRIDSEQCSDQDEILVLDSSSISVKVGKRRWFQVRGSQV